MQQNEQQAEDQAQPGEQQAEGQGVGKAHQPARLILIPGKMEVIRRLLHRRTGRIDLASQRKQKPVPCPGPPQTQALEQAREPMEQQPGSQPVRQRGQDNGRLSQNAQGRPVQAPLCLLYTSRCV